MKLKHILPATLLALMPLAACTDDFEEVNTNPNKVYDVELGDVFAGTVYRSMNIWAELNYKEYLNASRYAVVFFKTNPHQETDDRQMRTFYVNIINDLVKLERKYEAEPQVYANRLAIVKTWKSYCFYVLASTYGPVPMSDAISDGSENKRYYKYDTEQEIYTAILTDLKEAVDMFNPETNLASDKLEMDPVFGAGGIGESDLNKWRKFANTLRLNIAMHVQNIDMELARTNATEALKLPLISSNDENVVLRWGSTLENSASYYYREFIYQKTTIQKGMYPAISEYLYAYMRSLNDPRLEKYVRASNEMASGNVKPFLYTDTITRPHQCFNRDNANQGYTKCPDYAEHQADKLNKFRRDSIEVQYMITYVPMNEQNVLPTGWRWATVPGQTYQYSDPLDKWQNDYNPSYVQENFVGESATMTLLTYADACFLRAEAELVFNSNIGAARAAYEEGITASMMQYGVGSYADYIATQGVKWGTDMTDGFHDRRQLWQATINGSNGIEGALEQVYKQRYFADFFNGLEGWNLDRRTRVMGYPPYFASNPSSEVEGVNPTYNFFMERLIYPDAEISKNATGYREGVSALQASSPYARPERGGDNVFTTLAFAKKNPGLQNADKLWTNREVAPFADYFKHWWGGTYEDVTAAAQAYTGDKIPTVALGKISYKWSKTVSTYATDDMPASE